MKRVIPFTFLILCCVSAAFAQTSSQIPNQKAAEKAILMLEKENDRATVAGDRKTLNRLYADDFSGIDAGGGKTTKKQILDVFASDGSVVAINDSDETVIRIFEKNAIVTARLKYQNGKNFEDQTIMWMRYTRFYVFRNKTWVIVAEHYSFIDDSDNAFNSAPLK